MRIHGSGIGGHGTFKTIAGLIGLAQTQVLFADQDQQGGVAGRQVGRAFQSLAGRREIKFACCGAAQLEPEFRHQRKSAGQFPVGCQGSAMAAGGKLLLRLLQAGHIARRTLQVI